MYFVFFFFSFGCASEQRGESGVGFSWLASKVVIRSLFFLLLLASLFLDFLVKAKKQTGERRSFMV